MASANPVANQQYQQNRNDMYQAYDFFVYSASAVALAAGASQTVNFTIQAEADFMLSKMTMFADVAAAAQTESTKIVPLVSILISDTGSGRNLMDTNVAIPNIFGYGDLPFILPRQRIFVANSVVNVTFTNFSAATTYNLKLSFIGEKAFKYR